MNIYDTVTDLKLATLQAGQNVKVRGLDALLDGGNAEYYVQTLADFGGVPPVGSDINVSLANTNVAVKLAADVIPVGAIILWSGIIADIPDGWVICDGDNGTPNLKDRFVVGAGTSYFVNNSGGSNDLEFPDTTNFHTLTEDQIPAHTHETLLDHKDNTGVPSETGMQRVGSEKNASGTLLWESSSTGGDQAHQHTIPAASPGANRPPYWALAYIQKIAPVGQVLAPLRPEGLGRYIDVSGVVDLDAKFGAISVFEIKPDADITELNIINSPEGVNSAYGAALKIIANGGFTVTFGSQFNFTGNTPPTLSTVTDDYDYLSAFTVSNGVIFDAEHSIASLD